MIDSNLMTANNLDENPRMQHNARTTNTIKLFEPAGFITVDGGFVTFDDISLKAPKRGEFWHLVESVTDETKSP